MKTKTLLLLLISSTLVAEVCLADTLVVVTRGDSAVNLYRVRGAGLQLLKSILVGKRPNEVCADPHGKLLFVGQLADKNISVIDLSSQSVVATMADPEMKIPDGCAVSPDSSKLYMVDGGANTVFVFSTQSNQLLAKIPVGKEPRRALFSRDGKTLLISNAESDSISVIDVVSNKVVRTIKTGHEPREMVWTPDGKFLAVALIEDDCIAYFAADTLEFDQQVGTQRSPQRLAISPDGQMLFSNSVAQDAISIADLSKQGKRRLLTSIPVNRDAWNMALSADGKYVYVSHIGVNKGISVIDLRLMKVVDVVSGGDDPFTLLYMK
jgi:YVTN family beta-propeller protein